MINISDYKITRNKGKIIDSEQFIWLVSPSLEIYQKEKIFKNLKNSEIKLIEVKNRIKFNINLKIKRQLFKNFNNVFKK